MGAELVKGAVQLGTSAAAVGTQAKISKKQQLRAFAQQKNMLMIENLLQNQNHALWDTPEAQRRQIEQAGLSIGMLYGGGGTIGSGQSASSQAPSTAQGNPVDTAILSLNAAQLEKTLAEAEKAHAEAKNADSERNERDSMLNDRQKYIQAQTDYIKQTKLTEEQKTRFTQAEAAYQESITKVQQETEGNQIEQSKQELRLLQAKVTQEEFNAEHQPEQWSVDMQLKAANIKEALAKACEANANAAKINYEVEHLSPLQVGLLVAQTQNLNSASELNKQLTRKEREEVKIVQEHLKQEQVKTQFATANEVLHQVEGYADILIGGISAIKGTPYLKHVSEAEIKGDYKSSSDNKSFSENWNYNTSMGSQGTR